MISVFVAPTGAQAWVVAVVTMLSLALTGLISAKIVGTSVARSVVRLVVGGGLGLALAYGAGALFGGVAQQRNNRFLRPRPTTWLAVGTPKNWPFRHLEIGNPDWVSGPFAVPLLSIGCCVCTFDPVKDQ